MLFFHLANFISIIFLFCFQILLKGTAKAPATKAAGGEEENDYGFEKIDASGDTSGFKGVQPSVKPSVTPKAFAGGAVSSKVYSKASELPKQKKAKQTSSEKIEPPPPAPYIPIGLSISSSANPVSVADFDLLTCIGKGSFGKVLQVRKKTDGRIMAMKIIKKNHIFEHDQSFHTITERTILATIPHPFIPRLHYAFQNDYKLYMVIDIANGGELFFHLRQFDFYIYKFSLP